MPRVTVRDVAARAGVSASTVSNVLNGYPHLRPDTRARVLAAVEALQYRPSDAGRSLRSGTSRVVVLAIPDLRIPYFAELAHHLGQEASRRRFALLVSEHGADPSQELRAAANDGGPDAAAIVLFAYRNPSRRLRAHRSDLPTVVLGRDVPEPWTDHFVLDIGGSAEALVEHLTGRGRRRIAYLGWLAEEPHAIAKRQVECLRDALRRRGLELEPQHVLDLDGSGRREGRVGAELLMRLPQRPDAVVAANSEIAEGALSALRSAGRRVPEEVAVACWGGTLLCEDPLSGITAIHQHHDELARQVWDVLEARLAGIPAGPSVAVGIPWSLSARATTGAPPEQGDSVRSYAITSAVT